MASAVLDACTTIEFVKAEALPSTGDLALATVALAGAALLAVGGVAVLVSQKRKAQAGVYSGQSTQTKQPSKVFGIGMVLLAAICLVFSLSSQAFAEVSIDGISSSETIVASVNPDTGTISVESGTVKSISDKKMILKVVRLDDSEIAGIEGIENLRWSFNLGGKTLIEDCDKASVKISEEVPFASEEFTFSFSGLDKEAALALIGKKIPVTFKSDRYVEYYTAIVEFPAGIDSTMFNGKNPAGWNCPSTNPLTYTREVYEMEKPLTSIENEWTDALIEIRCQMSVPEVTPKDRDTILFKVTSAAD